MFRLVSKFGVCMALQGMSFPSIACAKPLGLHKQKQMGQYFLGSRAGVTREDTVEDQSRDHVSTFWDILIMMAPLPTCYRCSRLIDHAY